MRPDFEAMLNVDCYNRRSSAFDKIILAEAGIRYLQTINSDKNKAIRLTSAAQ